ncbi:MAG: hypothetical protein HY898_01825 [Deltaproteobacteria bacterium]|nr:hypothetical protein [Deltaproteobacteria bacterium]
MTLVEGPDSLALESRGEVRFIDADARVRLRSAVEAAGWLLVTTDAFGPGACGLLDKIIEEEIEQALSRRGAPASGTAASSSLEDLLNDQLFRARSARVKGIALALGSLAGLVTSTGALDPDDSATVRMLAGACRDRPFALWLSSTDDALLAYGPPAPLKDLLRVARREPATPAPLPVESGSERPPVAEGDSSTPHDEATVGDEGSPLRWRIFMRELDEAQGPKPLAIVEKLFIDRYVPLSQAVSRGEAELRARQALQRFAKSFEKSYREAFAAAKVTRRRPPMVFDVPQIAARAARLHGARNVVLLLVDAMRFDVGARVQQLLREELTPDAVCTEQVLLWAALPTVTSVQVELLARGPQGLSEPLDADADHDLIVPRGKAASTIRRLRAGGREIHKLDVVQSMLCEAGPREPERIEELARAALGPIAKFARGLQARTLLFIFGDHGFELPVADKGTGPAKQGGGSPEQVLMPGHAWLIGGIH